MIEISDILSTAHARGIVHRDIKPDNVMISRQTGKIKIMDLGLAKLTTDLFHEHKVWKKDNPPDANLKDVFLSDSGLNGKPFYMSPEQVRKKEVDGRSDVFSLAVMALELVSGEKPFIGNTLTEVLKEIISDEPVTIVSSRMKISHAFQEILSKALEKNVDDRYQTMHDFYRDLKQVQIVRQNTIRSILLRFTSASWQRSKSHKFLSVLFYVSAVNCAL